MPPPLLSIDTLVTLLHPPLLITFLPPLITLSVSLHPYPAVYYTSLIPLIYTIFHILGFLNQYIAYGPARTVDWKNEVVVITGGAGGLGRLVAEVLRGKGAGVGVWDLREPEGWDDGEYVDEGSEHDAEGEGVEGDGSFGDGDEDGRGGVGGKKWYCVDVGDEEQILKARDRVVLDLGTPTILINNAGIVHGSPLLSLSTPDIEKTLRINLLSSFLTTKAFLPSMLNNPHGGTLVTVASVLGNLGASNLTAYTASKAGLIAFHTSIAAEIRTMAAAADAPPGAKNVKTVLVKPGQVSTNMFAGVETPNSFLGPVVDAKDLALEIVKVIESGRSGVIATPLYARWIEILGVMPVGLQRVARWMSGVDGAMEGFGKEKKS